MNRRVAALGVIVLAAAHLASAQSSDYTAIVERYRAGQYAEAVQAFGLLPRDEIERSVAEITARAFGRAKGRDDRIEPQWLEAALLLHTHAYTTRAGRSAPGLDDLRRAVLAQAADYRFIRCWYLFMTSYDQGHGGPAFQAYGRFDDAPKPVIDDPEAQLALGAVDEVAWVLAEYDGPSASHQFTPNLERAERALRRALASAPALHEARLRLARVLTLRKRYDDALATLTALPPDAEEGYRYLAALFEGDACERRGDADGAAQAYSRAAAILPQAESAVFALAHLRHAQGHRAEALDVTRPLISAADVVGTDPWLWYRLGTAWRTSGYLGAMQTMVTRR